MSGKAPIPLKNSKSDGSKFSAKTANFIEIRLDWPLRSIREFHMAGGCFWLPPFGQKLQLLLCGPEIIRTSVKMEFFNGIAPEADAPHWPLSSPLLLDDRRARG
jgi:hypothetical protein